MRKLEKGYCFFVQSGLIKKEGFDNSHSRETVMFFLIIHLLFQCYILFHFVLQLHSEFWQAASLLWQNELQIKLFIQNMQSS